MNIHFILIYEKRNKGIKQNVVNEKSTSFLSRKIRKQSPEN